MNIWFQCGTEDFLITDMMPVQIDPYDLRKCAPWRALRCKWILNHALVWFSNLLAMQDKWKYSSSICLSCLLEILTPIRKHVFCFLVNYNLSYHFSRRWYWGVSGHSCLRCMLRWILVRVVLIFTHISKYKYKMNVLMHWWGTDLFTQSYKWLINEEPV